MRFVDYAVRVDGRILADRFHYRASATAFASGYAEAVFDAGQPSKEITIVSIIESEDGSTVETELQSI